MKGNKFICTLCNSSNCYESNGAGLVSFWNVLSGTFVKFCQVSNSYDGYFIEIVDCSYSIYNSNFIDASNLLKLFWVSTGPAYFISCVFLNPADKSIDEFGTVSFDNCSSDGTIAGISVTPFKFLNSFYIEFRNCNKIECSRYCDIISSFAARIYITIPYLLLVVQ